MSKLLNIKVILLSVLLSCWVNNCPAGQLDAPLYSEKTKLVSQQIDLLKNRLTQAQHDLSQLKQAQNGSISQVNKQLLNQTGLDISVAKSNLDSVNIELAEATQTITRLEKDIQELNNQINAYHVFGLKMAPESVPDIEELQSELHYQKDLLAIEKKRAHYLEKIAIIHDATLQWYKSKYTRIESLLKSQTVMQLKEQQAKSELAFQEEQAHWLKQANQLTAEFNALNAAKKKDKAVLLKLSNEIFYANEKVNFTYLQMLIARYQDQIQQLKISLSRSSSINFLNKMGDQVQTLTKQISRVNDLLKNRMVLLDKRKTLSEDNHLAEIEKQYQSAVDTVGGLQEQIVVIRSGLESALKQELSTRQGLPALGSRAWLDLGGELLLIPTLTFEVMKNLSTHLLESVRHMSFTGWIFLILLQTMWVIGFRHLKQFLARIVSVMPDHEYGQVSLKWLSIKLLHHTLIDLAVIGNIIGIFYFCGIPTANFSFFLHLASVWLFIRAIITIARLCLLETVHNSAGRDVRLYYRLKWSLLIGGVITAFTGFIQELPVIYELKDLFIRIFLLFFIVVSGFLLKYWEVLPGLILPYIDNRHTYLKKTIRFICFLIPLIMVVNCSIGLLGYVNFVTTISWYENIFLMVLVGYLSIRGLLNEAMTYFSHLMIRHVTNGWLWTEAFLKPLDKVLKVILFLSAWVILFLFYGWDEQSPVVGRLNSLLNYHLFDVLSSPITPLSILEVTILVAVLFWAAKWTREFVYRLLLSRTNDMGIRNSIAILSQYLMIGIGLFICMRILGIDFRALAVVAGAFALGIGLGLRDIANNFVCGFILLLERPLRVGDTVTLSGFEGEVIHIGSRAVTVRTWDHMEVLVPNAEIFTKTFTNWTARDNIIRTVVDIKMNRHDNPLAVQSMILEVLKNHPAVLKEPVPEVYLKDMADGMSGFEIRYFINLRQVKSRAGIRSEILVAIWQMFENHGIKPPYPHHEIFLKGENAFHL